MLIKAYWFPLLFLFSLDGGLPVEKNDTPKSQHTEWLVANLLKEKSSKIRIGGNPQLVDSPQGEAVYFNGIEDALFLDEMPLESAKEFTIEMIFNPETNSPFEQRVLHLGEIDDDRMLLEIRAVENEWYFDGFVASGQNKKALIDEQLKHALGKWHHVALVVGKDQITTFVNGKQELTEPFLFSPMKKGGSSIGVRLNERSWFKGMIYKIRITPKYLNPEDFMVF